ncbi:HK97 gp10 family phage protein [Caldimonas brevitalea]|uniref:Phage protein n=1 Tax=Caldimonas brevitalea TaxID=413882 RepID=A0A0G3BLI4_9BURK|nr:HK97 gp10 family phage protein [Caldimonas brevitalea]AKJ28838.1 phage protein [Caldimonas brevitalea]
MGKWSIPIDRLAESAKGDIETVTRKVTLDLFARVVQRSPVDTGRFKGNWNVNFGAPDTSTTEVAHASRGDAEARKALSLPVGGTVYLTNSLPYAHRLEYGWSKQAPQGMVRLTVQEYAEAIQKALASR